MGERKGDGAQLRSLLFFERLMTQLAVLGCASDILQTLKAVSVAKYILFLGDQPSHLRLLCNATKRELTRR